MWISSRLKQILPLELQKLTNISSSTPNFPFKRQQYPTPSKSDFVFFLITAIAYQSQRYQINAQAFTRKSHHLHQEVSYSHGT